MSSHSKNLIILEKVDSTNNYAMAMVQNGVANSGDAVFAMEQTSGKGRRNKAWKSNARENIVLTIISEMQWLPLQQQFQLSVAIALGCIDLFANYYHENLKIKWPNDIFLNDRKAGGILIENVIKGNLWQWAIIGIGLNINQQNFESENFQAISLQMLSGQKYDVTLLAEELHSLILCRIERLKNGEFEDLLKEYNENLFCRNELVRLKKGNILFETKVEDVSEAGELITRDAIERRFKFDEVEWQLPRI